MREQRTKTQAGGRPGRIPDCASLAPPSLRNLRQRMIWENLERARARIAVREEEVVIENRQAAHRRLGLSREETVLFIGRSRLGNGWPILLPALGALASSAGLPGRASPLFSFLFLVAGLLGLLLLFRIRARSRAYLTSHRVLVHRRPLFGRGDHWSVLHYTDLEHCTAGRSLGAYSLTMTGGETDLELARLSATELQEVSRILREKLPFGTSITAGPVDSP